MAPLKIAVFVAEQAALAGIEIIGTACITNHGQVKELLSFTVQISGIEGIAQGNYALLRQLKAVRELLPVSLPVISKAKKKTPLTAKDMKKSFTIDKRGMSMSVIANFDVLFVNFDTMLILAVMVAGFQDRDDLSHF